MWNQCYHLILCYKDNLYAGKGKVFFKVPKYVSLIGLVLLNTPPIYCKQIRYLGSQIAQKAKTT